MKDIRYIFFSLFCVILFSFAIWLSILMTINPQTTDPVTIATFFGSLFVWLTGFIAFIIIYFRSSMFKHSSSKLVTESIFHSSFISLAITIILILQALRVLGFLEIGLIILLCILAEIYIYAKK